jgi:hypothetical protein
MDNLTELEKCIIYKAIRFLNTDQQGAYDRFVEFLRESGYEEREIENIDLEEIIDKLNGY